jgi:hypothetical protein
LNCHRSCKTCTSKERYHCDTCFPGFTFFEGKDPIPIPAPVIPGAPVVVIPTSQLTCSGKCCLQCTANCNKCVPTKNYDANSKSEQLNTPLTCVKCENKYALTIPQNCTLIEDIPTKIDLMNYYYKVQPPTLIFVFSHQFPLSELNNTYALSFFGSLKIGDETKIVDSNNPNIKRILQKNDKSIIFDDFYQGNYKWNNSKAYNSSRELENTSTNSEFHSNIQKGSGVD